MARSKLPVVVFIVLAVAIAVVGGLLAYTSTLQQSAQQQTQVTWQDANGNPITSLSLSPSTQGHRSQVVSFKCNPSTGTVTLRLSSSLGNAVELSQSFFSSCGSSPNTITLSIASISTLPANGTLEVFQTDVYKLSGTLPISVQGA